MARISELTQCLSDNPHFMEGYRTAQNYIKIGNLLRQQREAQGLTQQALANKVGMDQAEVSKLETGKWGKRGISTEVVNRVLLVLGWRIIPQIEPLPGKSVTQAENKAMSALTDLLSVN